MDGVDRGQSFYSEEDLRNLHAVGYFSGLDAGAQVVMASFNSWHNELNRDVLPEDGVEYNGKLHVFHSETEVGPVTQKLYAELTGMLAEKKEQV